MGSLADISGLPGISLSSIGMGFQPSAEEEEGQVTGMAMKSKTRVKKDAVEQGRAVCRG